MSTNILEILSTVDIDELDRQYHERAATIDRFTEEMEVLALAITAARAAQKGGRKPVIPSAVVRNVDAFNSFVVPKSLPVTDSTGVVIGEATSFKQTGGVVTANLKLTPEALDGINSVAQIATITGQPVVTQEESQRSRRPPQDLTAFIPAIEEYLRKNGPSKGMDIARAVGIENQSSVYPLLRKHPQFFEKFGQWDVLGTAESKPTSSQATEEDVADVAEVVAQAASDSPSPFLTDSQIIEAAVKYMTGKGHLSRVKIAREVCPNDVERVYRLLDSDPRFEKTQGGFWHLAPKTTATPVATPVATPAVVQSPQPTSTLTVADRAKVYLEAAGRSSAVGIAIGLQLPAPSTLVKVLEGDSRFKRESATGLWVLA